MGGRNLMSRNVKPSNHRLHPYMTHRAAVRRPEGIRIVTDRRPAKVKSGTSPFFSLNRFARVLGVDFSMGEICPSG